MKNYWNNLSPKTKSYSVIVLAVAVLAFTLYLFVGGTETKERKVRLTHDKQMSVLTDSDNAQIGLENVSGRVKYNDSRIQTLEEQIERLKKERDAEKNSTARDRAWQEKFDALTSEIQKQNAKIAELQEGGIAVMQERQTQAEAGRSKPKAADVSKEQAKNVSTEVVPEQMFERPSDQVSIDPATGAAVERRAPMKISVISEEKPETKKPEKKKDANEATFYIPAGSILTGTIITGGDYPTGSGSQGSPTPALIRLSKTAILPNRYVSDVRECFLLASGHGELSSERAQLRAETLSCIRNDGKIIETRMSAYVAGEDGKAGVKGRLVSKQGQMIARTLVSGFMSGMAEAFDYDAVPVLATSSTGTVQYQENFSSEAAKGGLAKGLMNSLDRVSEFYMDLAEQMVPVVEVNAGRQVDIVVTAGTKLSIQKAAAPGGINP